MSAGPKVVVVGTGFVGSAVLVDLLAAGVQACAVHAPRLTAAQCAQGPELPKLLAEVLSGPFAGADVVVNAAGDPDASSGDEAALDAANGWLPVVIAVAARRVGVRRVVHVSSAVVQGRRAVLDETAETEAFSPYSRSKAAGEARLAAARLQGVVIYRPPSVHELSRRVTRMTCRIASSPVSTVLAPGSQPTPQALLGNVASAVAHLATCSSEPPLYVIHPWEGVTAAGLLEALGGRTPRRVPRLLGVPFLRALTAIGRLFPRAAANARRVEMLWAGQRQAPSWLTQDGWTPPLGSTAWRELGLACRARQSGERPEPTGEDRG
ncbi:NAD-dependent epimerase/dehydratase family protein [Angustibacter sp. McL0619]|uniref:NAD-dependent epimerase/dehydratase family protein n=1 Tax=Angustibacter sp. McL0619 TaxID=3415676 RepID=UPI003CE8BCFC